MYVCMYVYVYIACVCIYVCMYVFVCMCSVNLEDSVELKDASCSWVRMFVETRSQDQDHKIMSQKSVL
jgi:hypothetical protein